MIFIFHFLFSLIIVSTCVNTWKIVYVSENKWVSKSICIAHNNQESQCDALNKCVMSFCMCHSVYMSMLTGRHFGKLLPYVLIPPYVCVCVYVCVHLCIHAVAYYGFLCQCPVKEYWKIDDIIFKKSHLWSDMRELWNLNSEGAGWARYHGSNAPLHVSE